MCHFNLPRFYLRIIPEPFKIRPSNALILPKPSEGLFKRLITWLEKEGYGKVKGCEGYLSPCTMSDDEGRKLRYSPVGIIKTNFIPSKLAEMIKQLLSDSSIKDRTTFKPSFDNCYFTLTGNLFVLNSRIRPTKRLFWRYLREGIYHLSLDEVYVTLKFLLEYKVRATFISYRPYDALNLKFLRREGTYNLYRVEFDHKSLKESCKEIWEDAKAYKPSILPEPGSNWIEIKGRDFPYERLTNVFEGLDDWCLSGVHLSRRTF